MSGGENTLFKVSSNQVQHWGLCRGVGVQSAGGAVLVLCVHDPRTKAVSLGRRAHAIVESKRTFPTISAPIMAVIIELSWNNELIRSSYHLSDPNMFSIVLVVTRAPVVVQPQNP